MIEMQFHHFDKLEYSVTEAMNTLCTNLSFVGGDIRKVLITSCHPQEGKSFISMNLLRSMAGLGMKVILVDADIRASLLQANYGIEILAEQNSYLGLRGYLTGLSSIDDIIGRTNIPNADIILAGKVLSNSFPLFNSPRMGILLNELSSIYDLILIDAPPVGTIIDAAKIATQCDGALFVVESGSITINDLKSASGQIEKAGCPIIGYVMNKVDTMEYRGKYYSYYSGNNIRKNRQSKRRRGLDKKL